MNERTSGILLHISSLPSPFGIGDFGPGAYRFADFLSAAGQSRWQVLPLNYTHQSLGNSPYSCISAFAGNPLFISPELLEQEGLIRCADFDRHGISDGNVDYQAVIAFKHRMLRAAYENFRNRSERIEYAAFCCDNAWWLDDFALYASIRAHHKGKLWSHWEAPLRDRRPEALAETAVRFRDNIEREKFYQFLFFRQWGRLKAYCNERGISIIGDIPIYVNYDSADAWTHPELFKLDEHKKLIGVAGVPPDYFSKTGQRWGNPVYDWERLKKDNYGWWAERLCQNFRLFDIVRLDHFRGFAAYWEIPAHEHTAVNGEWVDGPGAEFFSAMCDRFGCLPFIAEDLGVITDDVRELMDTFSFPGMKILMFAFGGDYPNGSYLPHMFKTGNCVVYTGTHDNNTVRGWFEADASEKEKKHFAEYVGYDIGAHDAADVLVCLAMFSAADLAVFPLQDILNLGQDARMNVPGTVEGNWRWRVTDAALSSECAAALRRLTKAADRCAPR